MSDLYGGQRQIVSYYDPDLKTSLQKNKIIEKRIRERNQSIKQRFQNLKKICKAIRFQQIISNSQKTSTKKNESSKLMIDESLLESGEVKEIQEKQQFMVAKVQNKQVKQEPPLPKMIQDSKAKIQYMLREQRNNHQQSSHWIISSSSENKQNEPQKNESIIVQRSDNKSEYQTPKFVLSEKDSISHIRNSPKYQQDSQIMDKTKQILAIDSLTKDQQVGRKIPIIKVKQFVPQNNIKQFDTVIQNQGYILQSNFQTFSNLPPLNQNIYCPSHIDNYTNQNHYEQQEKNISNSNYQYDCQIVQNQQNNSQKPQEKEILQTVNEQYQYLEKSISSNNVDSSVLPNLFNNQLGISNDQNVQQIHTPKKKANYGENQNCRSSPQKQKVEQKSIFKFDQPIKVGKSKNRLFKQKRKKKDSSSSSDD